MRLIDADALFREMEKAQWYNNADRDKIAEELVLNAPTIEQERKKGRWIYNSPVTMKCEQCGYVIKDWEWNRANYCAGCGADMKGEQND